MQYIHKRNMSLDLETAENVTHLNPLLLSAIPLKISTGDKIPGLIEAQIVFYLQNLLHSLINFKRMEEWLQNELEETVRWIYTSENKIGNLNEIDCIEEKYVHFKWVGQYVAYWYYRR